MQHLLKQKLLLASALFSDAIHKGQKEKKKRGGGDKC